MPSSSDLDASRSSFYFVLRSRLHSISAAYVTARWWRKAWTGIPWLGIRMYDSICPCEPSCSAQRVSVSRRGRISASAADPCCHFIQTWSQPNTKIRTWRPTCIRVVIGQTDIFLVEPSECARRPGVGRISSENMTRKYVSVLGRPRLDLHFLAKITNIYSLIKINLVW